MIDDFRPLIYAVLAGAEFESYQTEAGAAVRMRWRHLPFDGGVYDQARVNPLTWLVWQMVAAVWVEELKRIHNEKREGDGRNNAED